MHHGRNLGYGGALRSGFREASKPLVFYTDGDGQYDPSELALLWPALNDGIDVVNGTRSAAQTPGIASSSAGSTITRSGCCSGSLSATWTAISG